MEKIEITDIPTDALLELLEICYNSNSDILSFSDTEPFSIRGTRFYRHADGTVVAVPNGYWSPLSWTDPEIGWVD